MLRSGSYSVTVPGYLKLGISGFNPTQIVAFGPLSRAVISICTPINFTYEKKLFALIAFSWFKFSMRAD